MRYKLNKTESEPKKFSGTNNNVGFAVVVTGFTTLISGIVIFAMINSSNLGNADKSPIKLPVNVDLEETENKLNNFSIVTTKDGIKHFCVEKTEYKLVGPGLFGAKGEYVTTYYKIEKDRIVMMSKNEILEVKELEKEVLEGLKPDFFGNYSPEEIDKSTQEVVTGYFKKKS